MPVMGFMLVTTNLTKEKYEPTYNSIVGSPIQANIVKHPAE